MERGGESARKPADETAFSLTFGIEILSRHLRRFRELQSSSSRKRQREETKRMKDGKKHKTKGKKSERKSSKIEEELRKAFPLFEI